jgi:ornithine carbamoyltransferase
VDTCQNIAKETGAIIECSDDKAKATNSANIIYTDV